MLITIIAAAITMTGTILNFPAGSADETTLLGRGSARAVFGSKTLTVRSVWSPILMRSPSRSGVPVAAARSPLTYVPLVEFSSTILLCRNFWTTGEFLALGMLVFAFGAASMVALMRAGKLRQIHWMVPASLFAGALLMSQAAIDQTVPDGSRENWVEVGMGAALGSYNETCGNTHTYGVAGAGGQYTHNINGRHQLEAGIRTYFGQDNDRREYGI